MTQVTTIEALEALYDVAVPTSLNKVVHRLTPHYRTWLERAKFVVLSTVGPEGTDASPRGDDGPVVRIGEDETLLMPDWRGNNRLDSLRNIVRDGRVSLMFMVPGTTNVVRVNGRAILTTDADLLQSFEKKGKLPRTVIVITPEEYYFQCAKAILRSGLWTDGDQGKTVPTAGDFIKEVDASFDGESYDANYVVNAQPRMW